MTSYNHRRLPLEIAPEVASLIHKLDEAGNQMKDFRSDIIQIDISRGGVFSSMEVQELKVAASQLLLSVAELRTWISLNIN